MFADPQYYESGINVCGDGKFKSFLGFFAFMHYLTTLFVLLVEVSCFIFQIVIHYVSGFYIIQPGSTVATALSPEEAKPKHVALITISGRKFFSQKMALETPRQFLFADLAITVKPPSTASKNSRSKNMPVRLFCLYLSNIQFKDILFGFHCCFFLFFFLTTFMFFML